MRDWLLSKATRLFRPAKPSCLVRFLLRDPASDCRAVALSILLAALNGCGAPTADESKNIEPGPDGIYRVHPGMQIQPVLDRAAADPVHKQVRIHAGNYRPQQPGSALIWLNAQHDGLVIEAEGEVTLTAGNPDIADKGSASYPAVVAHVVYFGDGISNTTRFRGFRITGANGFVASKENDRVIEPRLDDPGLESGLFFQQDGGGIKIFGRSHPTIEDVTIHDNYASPCGGGVSVEHRGFNREPVTFRNCVFRNNRCQVTGSAIDVLRGSAALIENCLFVGNLSNRGEDNVSRKGHAYHYRHGSGALTVFGGSSVRVNHCTFTENWNGADDEGFACAYINSIFWRNTADGGTSPGDRYELDIRDSQFVEGCVFDGNIEDLQGNIDRTKNVFGGPSPDFDVEYRPQTAAYEEVGYRPVPLRKPQAAPKSERQSAASN